jgi:hypothetical protein
LQFPLKIRPSKTRSEYQVFFYLSWPAATNTMKQRLPIHRSLLKLLFSWRNARLVEQAAGEIARQCRAPLWQRTYLRMAEMSMAQIRGYVRAHAAALVESEVDRVLCHRSLSPALYGEIREAAIGQLIGGVAHDVLNGELPASTRTMAA